MFSLLYLKRGGNAKKLFRFIRVRDLKGFMVQWFTNINNQKFEPVKIKRYEQEEENGMEW